MKRIAILLVIGLYTLTIGAQNWMHSFEESKKLALASNKLILVDFWATWCGPCKKMDADTWNQNEVKDLMGNFVSVKIDIDEEKSLATKYGIRSIPNIFIMDANGKVIYSGLGYKDKTKIARLLEKYSVKTDFLQKELINFYKKENYNTALRIANKYQIYSIYASKEIQHDFLILAKEYFDIAKKDIKKKKLKNAVTLNQKIKLFKYRKELIRNKPKKVLKKLEKIKEIAPSNKSLFSFLNYVAYKQSKDEDNAKKWYEKLNEKDKSIAALILKEK